MNTECIISNLQILNAQTYKPSTSNMVDQIGLVGRRLYETYHISKYTTDETVPTLIDFNTSLNMYFR